MRVAALYDVHGNAPALEAVLTEVRAEGFDRVVVGGDVVPGPLPRHSVELLRDLHLPVDGIHGNGELDALATLEGDVPARVPAAFHEVVRWAAAELTHDQVTWIRGWGATSSLTVPGVGHVLFCHATPRSDAELFTRRTPEARLRPLFEPTGADVVVCGHTHMQFDRRVGGVRVVNAGSVGMPFEPPGAYWLALGPDVVLRRTDYDRNAAAARIRASGYPGADAFAAGNVLATPARDAMEEAFEGAALAPPRT